MRFFTILNRNWTYEIENSLEIIRMIFINVFFLLAPIVLSRALNVPNQFIILIFLPPLAFWWYYFRNSLGRFAQIKSNKRYSLNISKSIVEDILKAYPKKPLYCKIDRKYKRINCVSDIANLKEGESILLITVGRTQAFELKKIRRILRDAEQISQ